MTPAGRRRWRISFHEQIAVGENTMGEPDDLPDLPRVGRAWAQISYGRADERREAAVERAEQVATFTVPATRVTRRISTGHIIRDRSGAWDITGIAPWERSDIQFTAIRRTA